MAAFKFFSPKILLKTVVLDSKLQINNRCMVCVRLLSYSAKEYGGNPDPRPIFIRKEVQDLLKTLTRVDLARVYKKRKLGGKALEQPEIKFMTSKQLEEAMDNIKKRVDSAIQMPPIVPVRKPINQVISKDPELQGWETCNYVFTDITFGLHNSERLIAIREPDGTLRHAEWEERDRINQIYFPIVHRSIKLPKIFEDDYFESVLKRGEYEFILDRACLQFEPDDPLYQKIVTVTYQYVNDKNAFDTLRSTRHFGGFAFFLAWNKMMDGLLLDLMETGHINEIDGLIELYGQIHNVKFEKEGPFTAVEEYVKTASTKRGSLELSLQALKNVWREKEALEEGIKKAHGLS